MKKESYELYEKLSNDEESYMFFQLSLNVA